MGFKNVLSLYYAYQKELIQYKATSTAVCLDIHKDSCCSFERPGILLNSPGLKCSTEPQTVMQGGAGTEKEPPKKQTVRMCSQCKELETIFTSSCHMHITISLFIVLYQAHILHVENMAYIHHRHWAGMKSSQCKTMLLMMIYSSKDRNYYAPHTHTNNGTHTHISSSISVWLWECTHNNIIINTSDW